MDIKGRVALVTGAGQGIGKAIALKLATYGATVVINDINEKAEDTTAEIVKEGGKSMSIIADVSSAKDVEQMLKEALEVYGQIDILVNNAGITRDSLLMRMEEDSWDKVLEIDLKSVFLCSRAIIRQMLRQRYGRIINIASIVGQVGNAGQTNYAAAKAGVIGFSRALAKEVAAKGITVNAIAPGFIETEMTKKLNDQQRQELAKNIPMGSLGSPEDVAGAVLFLASDAARYVTGQVITVDGGMTCV
jgi:3-oxoacyl-[acyl-carrier protein] reductase